MTGKATYSFNDFSLPTGGVILKASDGVEFKVYKNILALSSSVFRDMFTLPQPNEPVDDLHAESPSPGPNDVQVVAVSEKSDVLDTLLRFIYPIGPPSLPGVSEAGVVTDPHELYKALTPVLAAAVKYDMQIVAKDLSSKLLDAAEVATVPSGKVIDDTLALRIYAFACQHHLKDIAHRAAHASLKGRVVGVFVRELRQITAAQYFHLAEFHRKITTAVSSLVYRDKVYNLSVLRCDQCGPVCSSDSYAPRPASWWVDFVDRARPILLQSPKSDVVFSSDFLKESFQQAKHCGDRSTSSPCLQAQGNWPVISQTIKEEIDNAIAKNEIDLSEI